MEEGRKCQDFFIPLQSCNFFPTDLSFSSPSSLLMLPRLQSYIHFSIWPPSCESVALWFHLTVLLSDLGVSNTCRSSLHCDSTCFLCRIFYISLVRTRCWILGKTACIGQNLPIGVDGPGLAHLGYLRLEIGGKCPSQSVSLPPQLLFLLLLSGLKKEENNRKEEAMLRRGEHWVGNCKQLAHHQIKGGMFGMPPQVPGGLEHALH